ncbi:MAG: DUF4845 domain-containing protein [Candidatus Thiodiazotropha sp.]
MTFLSWLVVLAVLGFIVMVGIKITPVYLEHYSVKESLESLKHEPLISRKPVGDIRKMLFRRLEINNITTLSKDEVSIKRSGGVTTINVSYEERRPIFGNLSLVMTFNDSVELIAN